ncbi:helix-turn-helix domain-containing protein [Alteromonas sediminis]|uniref:Helix-turn-helix domain-containing protein n=1 Tax=Alteromonas sediminis TaxID=2259342 RepID=A0A3N5Z7R8_9ALTE|nr:helix-turn-helix domain-containing protein [Alteromonas sediminis]RPJ66784.1 helix-turn-helix domain-containing protein [Alteromonas sediminis]
MQREERAQDTDALLSALSVRQLIIMFDLLPNTLFWIKDENSRFVYINQCFLDHSNKSCVSQLLGKDDFAISPPHLARQYILDDKKVMAGHLVTDRIELNHLSSGDFGWFSTSKRPLCDDSGGVLGTYGLTQYLEQSSQALSNVEAVKVPVEYIRCEYHRPITIAELADLACLSVSALERRFKKHLGKTPKQFINEVRLENARRMLIDTKHSIVDIAFKCGFAEHSYFSKQFKQLFGVLPSQIRRQHESSLN